MQRNQWIFKYEAGKLAEAAKSKRAFHAGRLKFWEDAKEKVMAEVRESGIEVSESAAAGYSNKMSSGYGPKVMVRNDLQTKLTECHEKVIEHSGKVSEYEGWVQVLEGNPRAVLDLHSDDYLFFYNTFPTEPQANSNL